jgi:hypothetical protein
MEPAALATLPGFELFQAATLNDSERSHILSDLQAARIARHYRLSSAMAGVVAGVAFGHGRAAA